LKETKVIFDCRKTFGKAVNQRRGDN